MKKTSTPFYKRLWFWMIVWIVLSGIICCFPAWFTKGSIIDFTETGQIGDTIGGIMGPFVAIIAAFLTFIAFWVQKKANDAQRQDMKIERFNSNFYNLLDIHEQITNSLTYNVLSTNFQGRAVFRAMYEQGEYDDYGNYVGECLRIRINQQGLQAYHESMLPTFLDHYFRNLYRIVKYIDETDVFDDFSDEERDRKKKEYVSILRSTLSRYELVWLFYNSLSEYGKDKFKPLVERYALLNNIRIELVDEQYVEEYKPEAFGGESTR